MAQLIRPGLKFEIFPTPPDSSLLERTISTYGQEIWPRSNEVYMVTSDLSIVSLFEPTKVIGWELLDENDSWYFRIKSTGCKPHRCSIRVIGYELQPDTQSGEPMVLEF
jgi:hypothetical protein